jgi:hypothetical protein
MKMSWRLIFWAVTPCGLVMRFKRFGTIYGLHLREWRPWRQCVSPKCWYLPVNPHGITIYTTKIYNNSIMFQTWHLNCFRFRINSLERLLYLAESFVWDNLPTTEPETGSLAVAGWIPRIEAVTRRIINSTLIFHFSYVILKRALSPNPQFSYNSWYPFDTSPTIVFELVNASQVT